MNCSHDFHPNSPLMIFSDRLNLPVIPWFPQGSSRPPRFFCGFSRQKLTIQRTVMILFSRSELSWTGSGTVSSWDHFPWLYSLLFLPVAFLLQHSGSEVRNRICRLDSALCPNAKFRLKNNSQPKFFSSQFFESLFFSASGAVG